MQFRSVIAAALVGAATAQEVQVVMVGMNPTSGETGLQYFPERVTAQPGSMIQFQFMAGNHTITQSNFDSPCLPISSTVAGATGIYSGAMDVAASAAMGQIPVFTIMVPDSSPMWLYCSTGPHCMNGMAMVINENTAGNQTRSLENYKQLASNFQGASPPPQNVGGDGTVGGTATVSAPGLTPSQTGGGVLPPSGLPTDAAVGLTVPSAMLLCVVAGFFALL